MPSPIAWRNIFIIGLILSGLPFLIKIRTEEFTVSSLLTRVLKRVPLYSWRNINSPEIVNYSSNTTNMGRTPVYFFSHGGPAIIEDFDHPAYAQLQKLGKEITQTIKPKAVVVFSAHWQGEPKTIEVNTAESMGLIYDFYGFPPHFYDYEFPNRGDKKLAEKILGLLGDAGIQAEGVRRGLDHGVWASFACAFDPKKNPLNVPIVQVSLFDNEDPDKHYALGKAVSSLRDEGVLIIVSGMTVHNLRDFRRSFGMMSGPMPYAVSFDDALKEAVEQPVEERQQAMANVLKRPDARKAHPSFDHLLPIHIGAGAAGDDVGKQVWTMPEGSLSWGMYRFGEVGA
jgi:aromatic ring-opening dioxygenase catalytic subunit (LigB family)